jgi:branched-chain amino acid transport system permease protein
MRRSRPSASIIAIAAFVALMAAMPFLLGNEYYVGIAVFVGINSIVAIGLNLLMGYAGQVSLGHAAFMAVGAYTSAILTSKTGVSPWPAMFAGLALSCLVAALIGMPALKLHGHYLAVATLGFGMIVSIIITQWVSLTGGTSGLVDIPPLKLAGLVLDTGTKYYYLVWFGVAASLLLSFNLVNSRVGRALRAIHTSEVAAATCGVNIARTKLQVFVLSAALAGLAGSLYAHHVQFVSPGHTFGFGFSIELVIMVVFGGLATTWGAIVGAGAITVLGEFLRSAGDYDLVAFGTILLLVLVFLPRGIVHVLAAVGRRLRGGA